MKTLITVKPKLHSLMLDAMFHEDNARKNLKDAEQHRINIYNIILEQEGIDPSLIDESVPARLKTDGTLVFEIGLKEIDSPIPTGPITRELPTEAK